MKKTLLIAAALVLAGCGGEKKAPAAEGGMAADSSMNMSKDTQHGCPDVVRHHDGPGHHQEVSLCSSHRLNWAPALSGALLFIRPALPHRTAATPPSLPRRPPGPCDQARPHDE